ncbi:hypothetical protein IMZ31_18980 (plasmid) [Pontibacillus sp. ALD_SL1]|uniref:hypothetical protein n=1 Tax=Pontibacillus sp. ALD_SL1 TaxID=2777185 RepID=UPI001A97477B|nr:hypothetical protein [Pontibacillus sp. ALD_SL1]QST02634.1 hypothetical protein IMZ31_18980 [Pontibacillus sp. ALD_SL1]
MVKLYAVVTNGDNWEVVQADSQEEAFDSYVREHIDDPDFKNDIQSMGLNATLMKRFYWEVPDGWRGMEGEEDRNIYENKWMIHNINQFWHDAPRYAEEYIGEWQKTLRDPHYAPSFSTEFLTDTLKRLIRSGECLEHFKILKVDEGD